MTSLVTTNYTSVWNDDFADDTTLNRSLWQVEWGKSDDFVFANGGLTLRSTAAEGWSNTGFMQGDFSATSGNGYGLYSVTASLDAKQGAGICIVMWPSNNKWPGAEIDLLEATNSSRETGVATVHWKGTNNSNQYSYTQFTINLTEKHVYSVDWEKGSITYYVDGKEIFQNTSHVPLDAADGGVNESLGAEVTAAGYGAVSSTVDLNLYDMSYSKKSAATSAKAAASGTVSASKMQFIGSTGSTVAVTSGHSLTDQGGHNTLVLPASGSTTLAGQILSDTLDLRQAMTASGWDHQMSDITRYLSVSTTNNGADLTLSVHKAGGASVLLLNLAGEGKTSLATLEGHSLFT